MITELNDLNAIADNKMDDDIPSVQQMSGRHQSYRRVFHHLKHGRTSWAIPAK